LETRAGNPTDSQQTRQVLHRARLLRAQQLQKHALALSKLITNTSTVLAPLIVPNSISTSGKARTACVDAPITMGRTLGRVNGLWSSSQQN